MKPSKKLFALLTSYGLITYLPEGKAKWIAYLGIIYFLTQGSIDIAKLLDLAKIIQIFKQ